MALKVISRTGWGARYDRRGGQLSAVDEVIGHHSYIPDVPSGDPAEERAAVRAIERYHAVTLGWSAAPGYPWLVGQSGLAYEGVGWWRRGVHTAGHNSTTIAICFLINGDVRVPSDAAWQTAHELVAWGQRIGAVDLRYAINPHARYSTKSCAGRKTNPHLELIRTGIEQPDQEDDLMAGTLKLDDSNGDVCELKDTLLRAARRGPWNINPGWAGGGGGTAMDPNDPLYDWRCQRAVRQMAKLVGYRDHDDGRRAHPNMVGRVRSMTDAHIRAERVRRDLQRLLVAHIEDGHPPPKAPPAE